MITQNSVGNARPLDAAEVVDVVIVGAELPAAPWRRRFADGRRRIVMLEARRGTSRGLAGELIHPTGAQGADDPDSTDAACHGRVDVAGFAVVREPSLLPTQLPCREIPRARATGFAMEHRELCRRHAPAVQSLPGVELRFGNKVDEILRNERGRAWVSARARVRWRRGSSWAATAAIRRFVRSWSGRKKPGLSRSALQCGCRAAPPHLPVPGYGYIFPLSAWGRC